MTRALYALVALMEMAAKPTEKRRPRIVLSAKTGANDINKQQPDLCESL